MSHLTVQELSASLDGVLTGPALEQVAAHLVTCHDCRENQARLTKHDDALRRLLAQDPKDRFIDELARRSEALVVAILQGRPVPPFVTTMPLHAEEEPDDAHEPTSPESTATPGAPVLRDGDAAGAAGEAGFGRIGMRPTGSTQAPGSDPEIARRMLEEIERANTDTFEGIEPVERVERVERVEHTEKVAFVQHEEPRASDSGPFKPPGWTPGAPPSARESSLGPGLRPGTPAVEESGQDPVGPGPRPAAQDTSEPGYPSTARVGHAGASSGSTREPVRTSPPRARGRGFGVAHGNQPAWERLGLEPDPFSPGVYRDPLTGASIEPPVLYARQPASAASRRRGSRVLGPAAIAALATVCGLLVLVLALRTAPAGAPGSGANGGARFSLRLPRVEFVRKPGPAPSAGTRPELRPSTTGADVRDATTPAPVDRAVPSQAGTASAGDPLRVCGQVVGLTGKPLAGVLLTVDGSPAQVRSDAEGRFCLSAPAGPHVVRIQGDGTVPQRISIEFAAAAPELRVLLP